MSKAIEDTSLGTVGRSLVIFGGGGHAKVVLEVVLSDGRFHPVCFVALNAGEPVLGVPVIAEADLTSHGTAVAQCATIAIGDPKIRRGVARMFKALKYPVVCHGEATVSRFSSLAPGTIVMPGAVINACARLGAHAIVNTNATIEHDCAVGDFSHICPRACLAGGVSVGDSSLIGAGAVVLPGRRVGHHCIVGAGAVVTRDVPDGATVLGNPARVKTL